MKKGFTLIELVITVAVIGLLSLIVILVLNPAELLRQSRDATRISDMAVMTNAIGLYLASANSPSIGSSTTCYTSNATTTARCGGLFSASYAATNATTSKKVNGTGWLPINLSSIPSGSPIGTLPVDPVNSAAYYYAYAASTSTTTFEIDANMESQKYSNGGARDVESTDRGNNIDWYEVGTASGFAL